MVLNPRAFKVLSFDIYGTLIDWETGIFEALLPLASKLPSSNPRHPSNISERENRIFLLTEYTNLEKAIQIEHPTLAYPKVLAEIYRRLATQLSVPLSEDEATEFGSTIGKWPAFPDTVAAMQELGKHYKLIVLSNVSRSSFNETLSGPLSGVKFDAIYTAEDIGSYKPDLKNFEYLIKHAGEEFGARKEEILKVAQSLYHDHVPVKKVGLQPSVWIKRAGDETLMGGKLKDFEGMVDLAETFDTLGDLAVVVKKAFGEA
ncbi:S-2-haloacid dehalogenase [Mollisia scopiformis]|uniref:S-2-haloacid dehalogenase n=1 Tax=Mollisia scopiformis TaxID=149040 RepID=A0A194X282_MOLSC|nr:S-2-haloacid dehalogenase [Mollisia scopiformis]KUJ13942.1 S-2-haloacid dehalogenase [Mollisia scopiformis]